MVKVTEQYLPSHDGKLRVFVQHRAVPGAGKLPVVCLHGLTRNSADFDELAEHLAVQGHPVFAFDQRGRGRSDWDDDPANYEPLTYCRDMWAAFDRLGIGRAVIVGTSMGGIMGMIMAASVPGRVAGLVLNDVGPEVSSEGLDRIRTYVGNVAPVDDWAEAAAAVRANNAIALPDYDEIQWIAFAKRTYQRRADNRFMPAYDPAIAGGLSPAETTATPPNLWALWDQLAKLPALVIRGAHSDILSETTIDRMVAAHPGLGTAAIPNRGHAPMLDEPAALLAIDEFLAGLES